VALANKVEVEVTCVVKCETLKVQKAWYGGGFGGKRYTSLHSANMA
jgi:hypothetical protein